MPLVLEEDARSGNCFDPATASTLYWKQVPVLVKQHDREDQTEQLTFRILSGTTRQNHSLRVLRIHASSEDDPFFLHTLEVSEEEFQGLKAEQGILVDFASFPGKIISLLERCVGAAVAAASASAAAPPHPTSASAAATAPAAAAAAAGDGSAPPRLQAVLTCSALDSSLRIVETNDFKQLAHISLAFKPGNDFAVKQFLAFRLGEVKSDRTKLEQGLSHSKSEAAHFHQQLQDCQQRLSLLQEKHQKQTLELEAELREQAAAAQQDKLQQVAAVKSQLEKEMEAAAKRAVAQQELLNGRIAELDAEGRKLRDQKYQLDSQVSELSHKLGSAQGSAKSLEAEVAQLRSQVQQLGGEKHGLEMQLSDARAKLLAAQEKGGSQSQLVEQQQARLADLEGAVRQWEARCADLRELVAGHEGRAKEAAGEVLKGNEAIERLQSEVRIEREKGKRKKAILLRQEQELSNKEAALAAAQREAQSLSLAKDNLASEVVTLKADAGELRAKLEESRQQLQSNEQMIRWLNQQVTDAQLQVSAVPGSRFKFRPSQLAGAAAGTPSLSAGSYGAAAGRIGSPGAALAYGGYGAGAGAGGASSGSKAAAAGTTAKHAGPAMGGHHTTLSFAGYTAGSPQTVTPRQEYVLPPQVASSSRHL